MQTVTIKDREYHIGKVNAFRQLHLVRRMAPITASLKALADSYDPQKPLALLEPLGKALACLPDADVEYIMHTCLEAVSCKQAGGNFAPVCKNNVMLFELELAPMLALAGHVMKENFGSFFPTSARSFPRKRGATRPEKTQEDFATDLRSQRDTRIAATDYLMAADYPLDDAQRAAWAAYRQALRDMPQVEGFPWDGGGELTPWPVKPV